MIRYQHHHLNYKESLENGLIPKGLKINKRPAIKPVTEDFFEKWNTILLDAKNSLVQLLLSESLQIVKNLMKNWTVKLRKFILMTSEKSEFGLKIINENHN